MYDNDNDDVLSVKTNSNVVLLWDILKVSTLIDHY